MSSRTKNSKKIVRIEGGTKMKKKLREENVA